MAQDSQSIDSLYDYFYLDSNRIHSLTSQLFDEGVITNIKQNSTESDGINRSVAVDLKLIKAAIGASESIGRTQERMFDSSWGIPLELMSKLQELNRLKTGLTDGNLGDLVLVSGGMKLFDAIMIIEAMPAMIKFTNITGASPKNKQQNKNISAGAEILKILPKSTQIDFADTDGNSVWMSVDPKNLTIGPGDIALKYGSRIPGTWHLIGFIDAYPDSMISSEDTPYNIPTNDLKGSMDFMLDMIRTSMGRSPESYGITPLMIFRTVS
ncbi:hypothetical protein ACMU9U_004111 [Yersinia enterocolitica]|nr:hypothetical protein [Yersinia enterocolitica]HEI6980800.1 hypothetical protein [Yersinia enterocolitica]